MPSLTMWTARRTWRLHQKSWGGVSVADAWRRWRHRRVRHSQRTVLRDLADDPHLLDDIGVTRDEALNEAERPAWDITDVHVHSI